MCVKKTSWLAGIIIVLLIACQKEKDLQSEQPGNNNNNTVQSIAGEWNFLGMSGSSDGTVDANYLGQKIHAVINNAFRTKNNGGTITVSDSMFISSNITYSIDTIVHVAIFVDDAPYGELDTAFVTTLPPSSDATFYTRNSDDSLTFRDGFVVPAEPLAGGTLGSVGAKISWSGDTLLLHINTPFTRAVTLNGVPGTANGNLRGTVKLKKR